MLLFYDIANNDYRLHIGINHVLQPEICMVNLHLHIFEAVYDFNLQKRY